MDQLWSDVRYGARMMLRNPGFTSVAILTLGLAIGANTAIFTWLNTIVLSGPPAVAEAGDLVMIGGQIRTRSSSSVMGVSYPNYVDFRDRNDVLSGLAGWELISLNFSSGAEPERVLGTIVTGNYFDVLGVQALLGRTFLPEEGRPGASPVAVVSHKFWRRYFGGDPDVVGRDVTVNSEPFTLIGVAPPGFGGPVVGLSFDVFVPASLRPDMFDSRGSLWMDLFGRLKPGVTIDQARESIDTLALQLEEEYPATNKDLTLGLFEPLEHPLGVQGAAYPVLVALMVFVGVVLLIACVNVANLLLARSSARYKETALRYALGSTRSRLIRQLLTESVMLSLMAGGVGLLLAVWISRAVNGLVPPVEIPVGFNMAVDRSVLAFTLLVSIITGVVFSLIPALRSTKSNLSVDLAQSFNTGPRPRTRLRSGLVVVQVTFSVIALIAAGLFVRSLQSARGFDAGFDSANTLLLSMDLEPSGYSPEQGRAFYRSLLDQVRALPGVVQASYSRRPPLSMRGGSLLAISEVEGYEFGPDERMVSLYDAVGPQYFGTMDIPLLYGRDFNTGDREENNEIVVVNQTFAERFWPGESPVGRRIVANGAALEIVGVAGNVKHRSIGEDSAFFLYGTLQQVYRPDTTLIVRTSGDPTLLTARSRAEIRKLDANLPVFGIITMEEHVGLSLLPQRVAAMGAGLFGMLALGLAALGVYGVVSYGVGLRMREIGLRVALGARNADVLTLILKMGLIPTLIGTGLGGIAAFGVTRFMAGLLFGVSPTDPVTFVVICSLLPAVAAVASVVPALRAMRADPQITLRYE